MNPSRDDTWLPSLPFPLKRAACEWKRGHCTSVGGYSHGRPGRGIALPHSVLDGTILTGERSARIASR